MPETRFPITDKTLTIVRIRSDYILAGYVPNVFCSYHICDVICDLLLNRRTATWNLFVLYNKELNFVRIKSDGDVNRPLIDHRQEPIKMPYYINKNGLYLSWIGSELHMN